MKKLIVGALALSLITTVSMAEDNNFYLGIGGTLEMLDGENGKAVEITAGYLFDNDFGIESKISKTVSSIDYTAKWEDAYYYYSKDTEVEMLVYSIWGTYNYTIAPNFTISPKIGFSQINMSITDSPDIDESRISFGLDAKKYMPSADLNLYVGYSQIAADVSHFSLGVQKNF